MFIIIAVLRFFIPAGQAEAFAGKVVNIADGDTVTVLTELKQERKIRLAEVDVPQAARHQAGKG
jgi:endonuclease YncB( thermonuclease family)